MLYSLYFTLLRPKRHLCIYDNVFYDTHFSGHRHTTCEYDYCTPTRKINRKGHAIQYFQRSDWSKQNLDIQFSVHDAFLE
jgi:hypothetical protein